MHVHWDWIKQRPQFVAEQLSKYYDVIIVCESSYRQSELVSNRTPSDIKVKELSRLPYGRFRLVRWTNNILYRRRLKKLAFACDVVWITHPNLYSWATGLISKDAHVVYDCMDDALEAPNLSLSDRTRLQSLEAMLLSRSDVVFVSATNLKEKLVHRYGIVSDRVTVVNNAINLYDDESNDESDAYLRVCAALNAAPHRKVVYLGTIEKWIDFDLIHQALDRYSDIAFYFIGPIKHVPKQHERLHILPPVPHHDVFKIMQMGDALIMPFKVDEFIQGVNPVKVYEYIYSMKPAIIVSYPETERFQEYVHLYSNECEFLSLINKLCTGNLNVKASPEDSMNYVEKNTWSTRVNKMRTTLQLIP
jgi:hypothetical protein